MRGVETPTLTPGDACRGLDRDADGARRGGDTCGRPDIGPATPDDPPGCAVVGEQRICP